MTRLIQERGENLPVTPGTTRPIGWGIIGTGNIAHTFAADFRHVVDGSLVAIASRDIRLADSFGEKFGIESRYGSYQALADDPSVDAVYIATPASAHKANSEICLRAGKAVLCEKPLTVTALEAAELIQLARQRDTFLMEAMWTRFLPVICRLRSLLQQKLIGEPRFLVAGLGSQVSFDPHSRVFNRELGGGALLQKGAYLLSLASMILGRPTAVRGMCLPGATGVDKHTAILLEYGHECLATLWCSIEVHGYRSCSVVGTQGEITIHEPVMCPSTLTIRRYGSREQHHSGGGAAGGTLRRRVVNRAKEMRWLRRLRERFPGTADRLIHGIHCSRVCIPPLGEGLHYQVAEVNRCLRKGRAESEIMPLDESLHIMELIEKIRHQ